MATGKTLDENPHVRFDEGEVASATPRRGSLLYTERPHKKAGARATVLALLASAATVAFAAAIAASASEVTASEVKVSSFGYDGEDSTEFIRKALASGARKVTRWIGVGTAFSRQ